MRVRVPTYDEVIAARVELLELLRAERVPVTFASVVDYALLTVIILATAHLTRED